MLVLDCSVTMAWLFEDEQTPTTEKLLEEIANGRKAVVPALWPLEVANVLLVAERRNRIDKQRVAQFWELLHKLNIEVEEYASLQLGRSIGMLARKHKLSSYNAAYLELAIRRELPLISLDKKLVAAAAQYNVN